MHQEQHVCVFAGISNLDTLMVGWAPNPGLNAIAEPHQQML